VRPHDNADSLQLCVVFNNQVVISKEMQKGDIVFYVPTDMQLDYEFCKENKLLRSQGGYLEDNKRNVKCIKLRGQRSDGIVLPIKSLEKFTDITKLSPGQKIDTLDGIEIVKKYIPTGKVYKSNSPEIEKKNSIKMKFPLFVEHSDTNQLDYNMDCFNMNDEIIITEKLHGTSGRTANTKAITKQQRNIAQRWIDRFLHRKIPIEAVREYISGTRRTVLTDFNGGYHGSNAFRKYFHDDFKENDKLHYGEEIFYEIVGYVDEKTPIMPPSNNTKTKDKEFIKEYGENTFFDYGCVPGQNEIYVYRMTYTDDSGYKIEYPWDLVKLRCEQMGIKTVPELDRFLFTTQEDLLARVDLLLDRPSTLDNGHVSEGVVIRRNNIPGFAALKKKGFYFKMLEGIIKDNSSVPDREELEEIE